MRAHADLVTWWRKIRKKGKYCKIKLVDLGAGNLSANKDLSRSLENLLQKGVSQAFPSQEIQLQL